MLIGYYVRHLLDGCAVNYLTSCQELLTSGRDNRVATCVTMGGTVSEWLCRGPRGKVSYFYS